MKEKALRKTPWYFSFMNILSFHIISDHEIH